MLINFITSYLVLISLIFYFNEVGKFLSKKIFKQNLIVYINIYLGFGFFISVINLIYLAGLGKFKYILLIVLIHFILLLFKNYKYLKLSFNVKIGILIFLFFIFSLFVFNYQYTNHDDINGYFNIYSTIINDNYKFSPDANIRAWLSSFGYDFIQSIFIFIGGYTSLYFFDQAFGCFLILIFIYEITQKKISNLEFIFFVFFISLSCLSLSATSMPNIIVFSLSLILLDELRKFYKGSENILLICSLFFIAYNLRFNYLVSTTSFIFIILFFINIFSNVKYLNKKIITVSLIAVIFLLPEFFHKFYLYGTISPVFGSNFYITNNEFFKEINFIDSIEINYAYFWFKIFVKKHLIFIILLIFTVILIKKKISFYLIILISYLISSLILGLISLPDFSNPRRYLLPIENALIIFLLIEIWSHFHISSTKNITLLRAKYLYLTFFAFILINLSLATYDLSFFQKLYLNRFESVKNIIYPEQEIKKPFFYRDKIFNKKDNKKYINEFESCLIGKQFKKDLLVLIKHAYLVKNKNINIIDYKYGFVMSEKTYPFFQSFNDKLKFFNDNYDQILIEKNILYNDLYVTAYINEFKERKIGNNFSLKNFYPNYSKHDLYPAITWLDFAKFLYSFVRDNPKSIVCDNKNFLLLKF
ncbi:hypothetical protein [Candidatus Pelagibacter sp. HIMB1593]|uniref:hypothetical protein n=1 Tax=Candidatus Pelagibacter sp. HIMB1593 TaxID=3413355 RepID=UPI003F87AEBB